MKFPLHPINAIIMVVAIAPLACRRDATPNSSNPAAAPNILLITLDTTRADHLGCYGHPAKATPNIDKLAAQGVRFEEHTCAAPVTLPSHATILTGLDPYAHGVRDNGYFKLNSTHVTLAEALKNAGYLTGAQIAAPVLNAQYGLDQGFDDYVDPNRCRGEPLNAAGCRLATGIADESIKWIRAHQADRFFLWAHFFDPHRTYDPPQRFAQDYPDQPYLGEIAYVDEQVGRIVAELSALALDDRTIVILTTDHGEGLGEHGEPTHAYFLYDSTIAGALIVRGAAALPAGRTVSQQVRSIDIAPTVLALCGIEIAQPVQGVDLGPLMRGDSGDMNLAAYSETFATYNHVGYSQTRSLRQGGWKYIHLGKPELFNLAADPGELDNLVELKPQLAHTMREQLRRLLEAAPEPAHESVEPTTEELNRLRSLGYVSAGGDWTPRREIDMFDPQGPDAKDRRHQLQMVDDGLSAMSVRQYEEAERIFHDVMLLEPDNIAFKRLHMQALAEQGKHAESLAASREVLAMDPDDVTALHSYGFSLASMGRHEEAVPHFKRALQFSSHDDRIAAKLGESLMELRRLDEARAAFERAVAIRPENSQALFSLALIAQAQNRSDAAIDLYRRTLRYAPDVWQPNNNLAALLAQKGDLEGAIQHFHKAVAANANAAAIRLNLGAVLIQAGRHEEARAELSAALRIAEEQNQTQLVTAIRAALDSID